MFRACAFKMLRIQSVKKSSFGTRPKMEPPFTAEQVAAQRKVFRSMPTYNPKEQTITTADYVNFFEGLREIGYESTPEQIQNCIDYSDALGGKIDIVESQGYLSKFHDPKLLLVDMASAFDKDKDGFISEEEYSFIVKVLAIQDPTVKVVDYRKFVEEADTNKDGKVSVRELQFWLYK